MPVNNESELGRILRTISDLQRRQAELQKANPQTKWGMVIDELYALMHLVAEEDPISGRTREEDLWPDNQD